jgi:hypothetical protein
MSEWDNNKSEHENIRDKLADIRDLIWNKFSEGKYEMVGCPYSVAFYTERYIKELEAKIKLQNQRIENLLKALEKSVSAGEFFSKYADCKSDSWACRCSFCKDVNSSKNLREAREALARDKELTRE